MLGLHTDNTAIATSLLSPNRIALYALTDDRRKLRQDIGLDKVIAASGTAARQVIRMQKWTFIGAELDFCDARSLTERLCSTGDPRKHTRTSAAYPGWISCGGVDLGVPTFIAVACPAGLLTFKSGDL